MIKTFKDVLNEARLAPLFHGTTIENLNGILSTNVMHSDNIMKAYVKDKWRPIVSFTRSMAYAFRFPKERFSDIKTDGFIGVIEVDQLKLTNNYKLIPHQYWNSTDTPLHPNGKTVHHKYQEAARHKGNSFKNQSEEAVVGDIKNISKYITRIIVADFNKVRDALEDYDTNGLIEDHPKLYDLKTKRFINV